MPTDADHAPFLLLSIRGEDAAADDEYQAMMRFGGLDENGMHRIRLTHRPLGPIDLDEWSGIILGGGPYNVSDPPESKIVDAATRRIRVAVPRRPNRRPGLPIPRMLLRRGHARFGHRRHRRPQLSRTGRRRHGHADRGGPRGAAVRRAARCVRCVRRAQGGGQFASLRKRSASHPRPTVPCRRSGSAPTPTRRSSIPSWISTGILTRIDVYKNHGYFAPESADSLKAAARQRHIEYPPTILRRFVERYSRRR